ncbi:MAG: sulfate adenylyltransferase subunit CysD [Gammaproteobacteria bacterium]|nr:sulfate adenylyltransferase subunit CysD [Gammaproteobacteria bacterium]
MSQLSARSAGIQPGARTALAHLDILESEAIHIMREVAAECKNPVLLFSGGKDSIVMLRLAEKAFRPGRFPFPLMHVDTEHNFPEVIAFRDKRAAELGERLIVRSVQDSIDRGRIKVRHENQSRNVMQTVTLLDAIQEFGFDACFGGARRDEEKARAKERIFSFRDEFGQWDPKNQRPELWDLYNTRVHPGENMRVFPLSNWTELDVWQYIRQESIPIVPLYFARPRKVVRLGGILVPCEHRDIVDPDGKLGFRDEDITEVNCRFRSLGCIPCTGAIESDAVTVDQIIEEVVEARRSERENRLIDLTSDSSMEQKKREGYF